ncbi:MAG TPA: Ig domain-containing protein [Thermoanaerobaculia bacterium]|nr:Ig domain-containing protein [Thermoanaerobaculia bacterium]
MKNRLRSIPFFLLLFASMASGATFTYSTGAPDFQMATASHPAGTSIEVETADDFTTTGCTTITNATFFGLLTNGAPLSAITSVDVEIYRIFPLDSTNPPSGQVPTRANSPSDAAFDVRDNLGFTAGVIAPSATVLNTVVTGIHPIPNQTTHGEGPVTGAEVRIDVTFTTPFVLPAGHYYIVPQFTVSNANLLWLSAPKTIPSPTDLQTWIRDSALAPDWLRIGTDIVGGTSPPQYNAAFSLSGTTSTISVNANNASPLTAAQGLPTSTTFTGSGGTGPYTFTETGALPTGVTLTSGGVLSGTPETIGSFPITVTATDSTGCSGTLDFTLNVIAPVPVLDIRLLALLAAVLSAIALRSLVR